MGIPIHGKHMQVTPALAAYAERKPGGVQSWFEEPVGVAVTLSVHGHKQDHAAEATVYRRMDGTYGRLYAE